MDKIKEVQKFYDEESGHYLADRYAGDSCEQISYLIRKQIVIGYLQGLKGKILDAGCGPAIYTSELVSQGFDLYSMDLSYKMLQQANCCQQTNEKYNWINGELERLPFKDNSFENIMSIGVIAYTQNTSTAFKEFYRLLKPGGTLIVQCSNPFAPTPQITMAKNKLFSLFNKKYTKLHFELKVYSFGKFCSLLEKNGFEVLMKNSYDFRLPFIDKFFPKTAVKLMLLFQKKVHTSQLFSWLGEGYVMKAKKPLEDSEGGRC